MRYEKLHDSWPPMKISRTARLLALALMTAMFFASCARLPTTVSTSGLTKSHFKKYGKKFPDTIYGKNKVKDVEVTSTKEVHKGLAAVEMFITLSDGSVQRIHATIERKPTGWRFVSWENAT